MLAYVDGPWWRLIPPEKSQANKIKTKKTNNYSRIEGMNTKTLLVFKLFGCTIILEFLLHSLYASKTKLGQSEIGKNRIKNLEGWVNKVMLEYPPIKT